MMLKIMDTITVSNTIAGTAGGTLLVVLLHIQADEILKTVLLAFVGAVVSYSTSVCIRWVIERFRKEKRP
jgi:mannitol-specific phosphotransferase system IIBC component